MKKLIIDKTDFSFLLKLGFGKLGRRLEIIRHQQVLAYNEYIKLKSQNLDTRKIEETGNRLMIQEMACIEARLLKN